MHSIWMVLIFTTSKFSVDACPSLTYKKIKNIYPMTKATCGPIIVTEKSITVNFWPTNDIDQLEILFFGQSLVEVGLRAQNAI